MKVFISWSGKRSRALATAVHDWLPNVIQTIRPWMSSEDIPKGSRWAADIATELNTIDFGIICLTPENLSSPWLLFEAGALSRSMATSAVATILLDIRPVDVSGPLSQFQHTESTFEDLNRLVMTINRRLEANLPESKLQKAFELWWPQLESAIRMATSLQQVNIEQRSERELLEEILLQARGQSRLLRESRFIDWIEDFARASNTPAADIAVTFGVPLSSSRRTEMALVATVCPFHKMALTATPDEKDSAGNVLFRVTGCCQFIIRLAYEMVKDA